MTERFNPYTALKRKFTEYVNGCVTRNTRSMWCYPKARLNDNWNLRDLWERVAAAEQLGYDVQLSATEEGLTVKYVKKIPQRPYDI